MIEVHNSTSISAAVKRNITFDRSSSGICPWATPMRASGTRVFSVLLHGTDGVHPIVDEEHLPAAFQLAARLAWRTRRGA